VVEPLSPSASHPASRSHRFHLCEPTVYILPSDLSMLSIISHPHTTLLRAFWTSARIPRFAVHGLYLTSGTTYSAHNSCGLLAVRLSSLALHFFPHTRPPDIVARLEYQGSLVNNYSSLDLCSIPRHCPHAKRALALTRSGVVVHLPGVRYTMPGSDDDAPAARGPPLGGRARPSEARESSRACCPADFPAQSSFTCCTVRCHEDVHSHIY
jgi:hypothetical protein